MELQETTKLSPMMEQWKACKEEAKEAILLFRLGDFYEAFYQDAEVLSEAVDVTLTKRHLAPMSGIPAHAAEAYIDKLIAKGYRVAIAEQLEDPRTVKGLVKRGITRIITPGTLIGSSLLKEKTPHFIASLTEVGNSFGLALFDVTCSDCRVMELKELLDVENELYRFQPKEILTSKRMMKKHPRFFNDLMHGLKTLIDPEEDFLFDHVNALKTLTQQLSVKSLDSFGLKGMIAPINAAGALVTFLKDQLHLSLDALEAIRLEHPSSHLQIDRSTLANLDLVDSQKGSKKHTLLHVLDFTKTPMGGRTLREWLLNPLVDKAGIEERLDAVEYLVLEERKQEALEKELSAIKDLERLITKVASHLAGPRDFSSLMHSLKPIEEVKKLSSCGAPKLLFETAASLSIERDLICLIEDALVDEPPVKLQDGHPFREGYHKDLDALYLISKDSKAWMIDYQTKLREELDIKTLKVGYSTTSGYYIEVTRAQADKVPNTLHRKQTLTNAERYTSEELKGFEEKVLTAEEKIAALELELFIELKEKILSSKDAILKNARCLGVLDALLSLALAAKKHHYVRPVINNESKIDIQDGRHPVIEATLFEERFIPNDTFLDEAAQKMMVITGPNMAGKSTYIRQVALIVIMAQMGSFVPAKKASICIVDKVFTRIGASDDLSRGQSTFMVEMMETALILHSLTSSSLVILDEIGRGTSTYDGISLAQAIGECLLQREGKQPKTLFATHYFELTKLEEKIPGAKNFHVAVSESGDEIIFLRKVVRGAADRSYGIHVARLAGLPSSVLLRANEILQHLEDAGCGRDSFTPKPKSSKKQGAPEVDLQLRFLPDL